MNLLMRPSKKSQAAKNAVTAVSGHGFPQQYFLDRLQRLQRLRAEAAEGKDSKRRLLIDHALYSTYWDCVELGVKDDARRLLDSNSAR